MTLPSARRTVITPHRIKPIRGTMIDRSHPRMRDQELWLIQNEGGGDPFDISGRGNNGTRVGKPSWVAGRSGWALNFDGVGDYVDLPSILPNDGWTISAWIKADTIAAGGNEVYALGNASDGNPILTFGVRDFDSGDGNGQIKRAKVFLRDDSSTSRDYYGDTTLTEGAWHHIAGIRNGSDERLYVNGILQTISRNKSGSIGAATFNTEHIGRLERDTFSGEFDGLIESVRVWLRPLSDEEVHSLVVDPYAEFRRRRVAVLMSSGTGASTTIFAVALSPAVPTPTATGEESRSSTLSPVAVAAAIPTPTATGDESRSAAISPVAISPAVTTPTAAGEESRSTALSPVSVATAVPTPSATGSSATSGSAALSPVQLSPTVVAPAVAAAESRSTSISAVAATPAVPTPSAAGTASASAAISPVQLSPAITTPSVSGEESRSTSLSPLLAAVTINAVSAASSSTAASLTATKGHFAANHFAANHFGGRLYRGYTFVHPGTENRVPSERAHSRAPNERAHSRSPSN